MKPQPLILTLKIDDESFRLFDALRRRHFPPERNFLAAHLTLFHHLLGAEIETIKADLREFCATQNPFALEFPRWRSLGKGVAVVVESAELLALRARLAERWREWLNAQDRQKFQPHITVQNKVAPADAKLLLDELSAEWKPRRGIAEGLSLWHYLGAEWRLEKDFSFADAQKN